MRFLLLCVVVQAMGIFAMAAAAGEPTKELAPLQVTEGHAKELALLQLAVKPTDGTSGSMKVKIQRYNACVQALRAARPLHEVWAVALLEFGKVGDELVNAALDIQSEPED